MTAARKVVGIAQARMGSTRLPGKVMQDLGGRPLIAWSLDRLARTRGVDEVWLATSDRPENEPLARFAEEAGYRVFRGSETDVLSRYAEIARRSHADVVIRVTGDCPFIDPAIIGQVIDLRAKSGADYATNTFERRHPDGLDVEVFTQKAVERADREAQEPILREHVTPYISGKRRDVLPWGKFSTASLPALGGGDFSHLRWTVDDAEDLAFVRAVVAALGRNDFDWLDVVALITRCPELLRINAGRTLNEGFQQQLASRGRRFDRSNQMFSHAIDLIPLASQTFSKSHQQWVKGAAPLFLTHGRGCQVWDVDGNDYIDYVLGLMPNILGYCDPDVDAAVRDQLDRGVSFSLATPLELDLAERLVRLIPSAEMVRYGKNGSDATSAAVRLARAHTGRDKVAICGYHGWHDWYIGTTTRRLGVPQAVSALSATFPYNDADALEAIIKQEPDAYAAVILEPVGAKQPEPGFLERLRALTEKYGVVLIFDEIVTGFRIHLGGAQARYGVTPDLSCFGKAMANGMPISAVVGRREIMQKMEDIFFSGTFGGDAASITSAIATIDKLERENAVERMWRRGEALIVGTNRVFEKHGLGATLKFGGEGWFPRLSVTDPPVDPILMTSLLRQEFVGEGLLLLGGYNLCLPHDSDIVMQKTMDALDRAISHVSDHLDASDPAARLRGERVRPTFSVR